MPVVEDYGPRFPGITAPIIGANGMAFNLIGIVRRELIRHGERDAAAEFVRAAQACESYGELLALITGWVEVGEVRAG